MGWCQERQESGQKGDEGTAKNGKILSANFRKEILYQAGSHTWTGEKNQ